jgi:hypothetical protein
MNSPAGSGGFMNWLPFGRSNASTGGVQMPNPNQGGAQQTGNPNFPSRTQLDQKNNTLDPNNPNNQTGNNEPGTDPNNNADPTKGQGGSSLDQFKDLFRIPTDDKGNPTLPADPMQGSVLAVNPEKLREAASKMNFLGSISQEQLQKAMSGQDPQAFMEVLNATAQSAFLQAMQVNAGVVETAIGKNNQRFEQALPDRIRNFQVQNAAPKHPALSHPAAQPMVDALKQNIARTNPHLTPDRVVEMAENYVIAMATDINNVNSANNKKNTPNNGTGSSDVDWMQLLGGN